MKTGVRKHARRLRADHGLQLAGDSGMEKKLSMYRRKINYIEELRSDHEEADSRTFVHLKYAYNLNTVERYIIWSPDTDVAVLGIHFAGKFVLKEVYLRTGIKHKKRFIPTHKIVNQLSTTMCYFLPAVHAFTGCDSNSSYRAHNKKSAFKVIQEAANGLSEESNIGLNPSHVSTSAFVSCKRFVCRVYDSKTSIEGLNVLRYRMFTESHTSSDKLPPTVDSMKQYIMRANYQSYIWYNADKPILNLRGWTLIDDKELIPLMMTKSPTPAALLKLSECGCEGNCGSKRCKCKKSQFMMYRFLQM